MLYTLSLVVFSGAHMNVVQGRTTLTEFLIACTCWSAIQPKFFLTENPSETRND